MKNILLFITCSFLLAFALGFSISEPTAQDPLLDNLDTSEAEEVKETPLKEDSKLAVQTQEETEDEENEGDRNLQAIKKSNEVAYLALISTASSKKDNVGFGVGILTTSFFGVLLSIFTQTPPIMAGAAFNQMQDAQLITQIDTAIPMKYFKTSQFYSYSRLDLEFFDRYKIRSDMFKSTKNKGTTYTGYTTLYPSGVVAENLIIEYIYVIIIVGILIAVHIALFIASGISSIKENHSEIWTFISSLRRGFEFSVYFYIILFTLPFTLLIIFNELFKFSLKTGLTAFSFIFSLLYLIFIIVVFLLPVLFAFTEMAEGDESEDDSFMKKLLKKLRVPFWAGIREDKIARLFFTVVFVKYFLLGFFLVILKERKVQLPIVILISILYLAYLGAIRPFKHLLQNIMAIFNAAMTLLVTLIFLGFLGNNSLNSKTLGSICGVLFTLSVVVTGVVGFAFQGFLLYKKLNFGGSSSVSGIRDNKTTENKMVNHQNVDSNANLKNDRDGIQNISEDN